MAEKKREKKHIKLNTGIIEANTSYPFGRENNSYGYTIYSNENILLPPGKRFYVSTDLVLKLATGVYGSLYPVESNLVRNIDICPIPIYSSDDPVRVMVWNNGLSGISIQKGDVLAEIVFTTSYDYK